MKYTTELWIETDHMNFSSRVWIQETTPTERHNIHFDKETGLLVRQTFPRGCMTRPEGEALIPFLEMATDHFKEVMGLLVTQLARNGIKPEEESVTAGKLQGMTDHKNDLKEIIHQLIPKIKA